MILSLIGMSGTGKTFWSNRLVQECAFERFGIDDIIEKELHGQLETIRTGDRLGQWMGLPYEKAYSDHERLYLETEKRVMERILDSVTQGSKNVVMDTTGSVIYLGDDIRTRLREKTKVIRFETPSEVRNLMFARYAAALRPVVWGGMFKQKKNESRGTALEQSYWKLLAWREEQYASWSHVTLDYHLLRSPEFTVSKFLRQVELP